MINKEDKWYTITPPNISIMKCELGGSAIKYLWECIETGKQNKINANANLVGNITESIYLEDKDDYFFNNHLKGVCEKYFSEHLYCSSFRNPYGKSITNKFKLLEFWVNFSKKHEFNPPHCHGGVLSFVIWMDIPTHWKEQYEIPFVKHSSKPSASEFQFLYTNILGDLTMMTVPMEPSVNGNMALFPATLNHQVHPFYESDGTRITVSGNIFYDS